MTLREAVYGVYYFLALLEYNIKAMTNEEFKTLLNDTEITYEQKLYAIYFRIR